MVLDNKKIWDKFKQDKFLIIGFTEKTGLSAALLFQEHKIPFAVSDIKAKDEIRPLLKKLPNNSIEVFSGEQTAAQLEGITKILLSPGVPRSIPLIRAACQKDIPVYSDIDFIYNFISDKTVIGITGTDGKTTTTMLLGEMLRKKGPTCVAGNIGNAVLHEYRNMGSYDHVLLELSSYMLEDIKNFKPDYAAITNIAADHMDRYGSIDEYAKSKFNIVKYCTPEDVFIQNTDDEVLKSFALQKARTVTVSQTSTSADYYYTDGRFSLGSESLDYAECILKGRHNVENCLIALAVAAEMGIDAHDIFDTIRSFPGVAHRLEYVGDFSGITAYNDSKATTIHAVSRAVESFEANIILILGGRDKGLDFSKLGVYTPRLKHLVCYGEAGEKIRRVMGFNPSEYTYAFSDAVERAVAQARSGDTILLSPGCTSWDQFSSYEERGNEFKKIINAGLKNVS
ncbi:UDP-N-acetylmuramoyl-L-alanine--D-glutamate ligase [Spirochaetota bacterium]